MSSKIASILELSSDQENSLQSLTEWLTESPLFEAAKEGSGTLKVVGKLLEKATKEHSPQALGWLACTLAYRKAAEDAIRRFGRPAARIPYAKEEVGRRIRGLNLEDASIMQGFSLASTAGHPFLREADKALTVALEVAGYDDAERRNLLSTVRAAFKGALQELLSGEQKEKFAGFTQWL